MISAFCFSTPGKKIEVLKVIEDDFCYYLIEHCKRNGLGLVAMDLETRNSIKYGVMDILRSGIDVVVVDPVYSPINDKRVLPLNVHRDVNTIQYHFPDAVVIGKLVVKMGMKRILSKITAIFETGEMDDILPLSTMGGWKTISKTENEVGLLVFEYQYNGTE